MPKFKTREEKVSQYKEVIHLRDVKQWQHKRIAAAMGIGVGYAGKLYKRAKVWQATGEIFADKNANYIDRQEEMYHKILTMRGMYELSFEQIGKKINLPRSTVQLYYQRARDLMLQGGLE